MYDIHAYGGVMLKSMFLVLCLTFVLASAAIGADQYSPPRGISFAGVPCYVVFRWPDDGSMYYLEVLASGSTVHSRAVSGSSMTLSLPPNDYRWRIRKFYNGEYHEIMELQDFKVISEIAFSFDGTPGNQGMSGERGSQGWVGNDGRFQNANSGNSGGDGGDGMTGKDVSVLLEDAGDYLKVAIKSESNAREFYLSKSSRPLSISSRGGRGGDGGAGGLGGTVDMSQSTGYSNYPGTVYRYGGSGGNGGNGGDGGRGGNITVISRGGDFRKFVEAIVRGGDGGRGGQGGSGGNPGGSNGSPGNNGREGESGKVVFETQ